MLNWYIQRKYEIYIIFHDDLFYIHSQVVNILPMKSEGYVITLIIQGQKIKATG